MGDRNLNFHLLKFGLQIIQHTHTHTFTTQDSEQISSVTGSFHGSELYDLCVALAILLNFCLPLFLPLKTQVIIAPPSDSCCEDKLI